MLSFVKRALDFLHDITPRQQELAYLNEAVSRADLERRQREIERGLFRPAHIA